MDNRILWSFLLALLCLNSQARPLTWKTVAPFVSSNAGVGQGVSAHFVGLHQGRLMATGGCNFPNRPAADGGKKVYYDAIFTLDPTDATWVQSGRMPRAFAYGAVCSSAKGMIIAGGCDSLGALSAVYRLSWRAPSVQIDTLPSLPYAAFNTGGVLFNNHFYVGGGVVEGSPSNRIAVLHLSSESPYWEELPPFPGAARLQPVMVALTVEGRSRIYIWGGFASGSSASVATDGYYWDIETRTWCYAGAIRPESLDRPITLGGGVGVSINDSQALFLGGVEASLFETALRREQLLTHARREGSRNEVDSLQNEVRNYLLHPPKWYRFNSRILRFDARKGQWDILECAPRSALAGAACLRVGDALLLSNGEIKPGVRTPLNWMIDFSDLK